MPRLVAAGATVVNGRIVHATGATLEPSRAFADFQFKACIFIFFFFYFELCFNQASSFLFLS